MANDATERRDVYKVLSSGVDWVTATAPRGLEADRLVWRARRYQDERERRGDRRVPWKWRDYLGFSCGGVAVGARQADCIAVLSSEAARQYAPDLLELQSSVSRLDLQVTVQGVPNDLDLAAREWRQLESEIDGTNRPRWRSLITTRPAGATLYVGSPASDFRARLYDKSAESPDDYPPGCWRYEIQTRRRLAGVVADRCVGTGCATATVEGIVHGNFSTRGVVPAFVPGSPGVRDHVDRSRPDVERTLKWLREQVRPAVERLSREGYIEEVLGALGLSSEFAPAHTVSETVLIPNGRGRRNEEAGQWRSQSVAAGDLDH